jgi:signal peptidase I
MNFQEMKSLGWTLLALLFMRAFVAEPYKIPSGSMIPTLLIGDHILVSKSSYDLRIPFTDIQVVKISDPRRGEVVVFKYPNYEQDPSREGQFFIKRLIGLPGDRVSLDKGRISINGLSAERTSLEGAVFPVQTPHYRSNPESILLYQESLPGQERPFMMQQYKNDLERLGHGFVDLGADLGTGLRRSGASLQRPGSRSHDS